MNLGNEFWRGQRGALDFVLLLIKPRPCRTEHVGSLCARQTINIAERRTEEVRALIPVKLCVRLC